MSVELQAVLFEVAGRRYAIPAADVVEVRQAVAFVPLPHAPAIVEGIFDLRGHIVTVLDLRARFHLPPRPIVPDDELIVARAGTRLVAVRADRILELAAIDRGLLDAPEVTPPGTKYVAGIARLPDGIVLVHDLCAFLSDMETVELEEALANAPVDRAQDPR